MAIKKSDALKRKYKATSKTIEIILNAISEGLTQRDASILAGISEDTLCLWKRKDSDFSEQIRQKEIEYKRRLLRIVNKGAEKDWRASLKILERKYPNEYAPNSRIDLGTAERIQEMGDIMKDFLTPQKTT